MKFHKINEKTYRLEPTLTAETAEEVTTKECRLFVEDLDPNDVIQNNAKLIILSLVKALEELFDLTIDVNSEDDEDPVEE